MATRLARLRLPLMLMLAPLAACDSGIRYIGSDCLPSGTDQELQAAIDQRSIVLLCPGAVITMAAPLVLRAGVTVQTAGTPSDPAQMATIRLAASFPTPRGAAVVTMGGGVHLQALRFDGNRDQVGSREGLALVELGPGDGYHVEGCVFTAAPGWTHLHLTEPCNDSTVSDNLVASAPRPHADRATLTDGLSISCAHSFIERNRINDISATGIVYFGGAGTVIRDNVISEATTSAYSGINLGDAAVADHNGVIVEGNTISAAAPRFVHVGIATGLHVFGKTAMISGVTVRDNQIEGMSRYGLGVDGCVGCTVENNRVQSWRPVPPLENCPAPTEYVAALTVAHAGGTLQDGYHDQKIDGCLGEPDVLGPTFRDYAGDTSYPEYLAFEVDVYSRRMQLGMDAEALLRAEWDVLTTRANAICSKGDDGAVRDTWLRVAEAQFGLGLSPADADAKVRADLQASPDGATCGL